MNYAHPTRRRTTRARRSAVPIIGAVAVVALVLLLIIGSYITAHATVKTETFTVTRVLDQPRSDCLTTNGRTSCSTSHRYLVFTDHGTYEDTDSLWFLKFNSSDLLGELQDGHRYRCKTTGFRFVLSSSYRNLIHCAEVL